MYYVFSQSVRKGTREKEGMVSFDHGCFSCVFVSQITNSLNSILTAGLDQTQKATEKIFETLNYTVI